MHRGSEYKGSYIWIISIYYYMEASYMHDYMRNLNPPFSSPGDKHN